jgi:hypothetical protein
LYQAHDGLEARLVLHRPLEELEPEVLGMPGLLYLIGNKVEKRGRLLG